MAPDIKLLLVGEQLVNLSNFLNGVGLHNFLGEVIEVIQLGVEKVYLCFMSLGEGLRFQAMELRAHLDFLLVSYLSS